MDHDVQTSAASFDETAQRQETQAFVTWLRAGRRTIRSATPRPPHARSGDRLIPTAKIERDCVRVTYFGHGYVQPIDVLPTPGALLEAIQSELTRAMPNYRAPAAGTSQESDSAPSESSATSPAAPDESVSARSRGQLNELETLFEALPAIVKYGDETRADVSIDGPGYECTISADGRVVHVIDRTGDRPHCYRLTVAQSANAKDLIVELQRRLPDRTKDTSGSAVSALSTSPEPGVYEPGDDGTEKSGPDRNQIPAPRILDGVEREDAQSPKHPFASDDPVLVHVAAIQRHLAALRQLGCADVTVSCGRINLSFPDTEEPGG